MSAALIIDDDGTITTNNNALFARLSGNDPTLTVVHVAMDHEHPNTIMPIDDPNALLVHLRNVLYNNTHVTEIHLRDFPQQVEDLGAFALQSLFSNNAYITDISIKRVKIEAMIGFCAIFTGIAQNPNSSVRSLTIASADYLHYMDQDEGEMDDKVHCDPTAVFLTDADGLAELVRTTTTLRKIDMSPNGLTDYGATHVLAPALRENTSVTEFNVSHNDDMTDLGLQALRNAMGDRGVVIGETNARWQHHVNGAHVQVIPMDE